MKHRYFVVFLGVTPNGDTVMGNNFVDTVAPLWGGQDLSVVRQILKAKHSMQKVELRFLFYQGREGEKSSYEEVNYFVNYTAEIDGVRGDYLTICAIPRITFETDVNTLLVGKINSDRITQVLVTGLSLCGR